MKSRQQRDKFEHTNNAGISTRPIWKLMPELSMYKNAVTDDLAQSRYLADTIVNIPSGGSSLPIHLIKKEAIMLDDETILVTGGTGSFGYAFVSLLNTTTLSKSSSIRVMR